MIRLGLFFLFAPLALVELLFYQRFDLILIGGLYFGLAAQADWSAARFLRRGLNPDEKKRHWSEDEPSDSEAAELDVQKLGAKKADTTWTPPPPAKETTREAAPQIATLRAPKSADIHELPTAKQERPRGKRLPSSPNFRGRAHEVLGIGEDARTRTIVNAFRHWIKRFHPDHARDLPEAAANQRVQQLTDARDLLLDRRRGRRAA
jgi:hypothetical protein